MLKLPIEILGKQNELFPSGPVIKCLMLHGLMSMLYLGALDLDYIIAVIGLNDQMNNKKQEVLKSERMRN